MFTVRRYNAVQTANGLRFVQTSKLQNFLSTRSDKPKILACVSVKVCSNISPSLESLETQKACHKAFQSLKNFC